MRAAFLTFVFLIFSTAHALDKAEEIKNGGFLGSLEDKLELKIWDFVGYLTHRLSKFNDERLGGNSGVGRFLHYEDIKPKVEQAGLQARGMKKMLPLIPLIFHIGATSTWLLLTMFLAAKSVAIGMILLIFKIAVSSAKLASFFTILKGKELLAHKHEWAPHYEHHGHRRSLDLLEQPTFIEPPHGWSSIPHSSHQEWSASEPQYKTLDYKPVDPYTEYAAESKKVSSKVENRLG